VLKQWLAASGGVRAWWGAVTVLVVALALVVLDITVGSVHAYLSRHSFTSSFVSGVLVLMLTVLIVDRVVHIRQLTNQSRAIGAQAAVIVAQAKRAADAVNQASSSVDGRDAASDELRNYTLLLFTSAPVLIDAKISRTFLETADRFALQLARALQAAGSDQGAQTKAPLEDGVKQLRTAADPLLSALTRDQRAAVSSGAD
jgi:uncharacterized protein YoxC